MKYAYSLAILLALAACHPTEQVRNDTMAVEVALTAAEQLAMNYTTLPRCGAAGATVICSNESVVATIKSLDAKAYSAVKAAENNEGTISAALTAIQALKSAVPVTPAKGA